LRLYKLQITVALLDVGEQPDMEPAGDDSKHPTMKDPLDRQEKMVERVERLMMGHMDYPVAPGAGNNIRLTETYDVPAESFAEAMGVLAKFHELGNKIGMPSTEPVRMPFMGGD
jgi:hypothetical protein